MEFTLPTTKQQMYTVLSQIFQYYRIDRQGYSPTQVPTLVLSKINFTPLTSAQISSKAQSIVSANQEKILAEKKFSFNKEIQTLNAKLSALNTEKAERKLAINTEYAQLQAKVTQDGQKRGLSNSSLLTDRIAGLESERIAKVTAVDEDIFLQTTAVSSEITAVTYERDNLETLLSDQFDAELSKKIVELTDEQDKKVLEIKKYNDGQDEKMAKQTISTALSNATLQLRFMELASNSFTKDQLVNMGYYDDVTTAVNSYYSTLSPIGAYQDFASQTKLIFYLDDYYQDMLYLYKTRAGV